MDINNNGYNANSDNKLTWWTHNLWAKFCINALEYLVHLIHHSSCLKLYWTDCEGKLEYACTICNYSLLYYWKSDL